jgi:hypothetical protein
MTELQMALGHLKQPEYIHVLLNPLPVWGMAIGLLLLLAGLLRKSRETQFAGLWVIAIVGAVTWFVVDYGHRGYDRVLSMSNEDAQLWLKVHMSRAEKFEYFFYGTSLLALAAWWSIRKGKVVAKALTILTVIAAGTCGALAGWIGHAGGQVRHSEFREGPPTK